MRFSLRSMMFKLCVVILSIASCYAYKQGAPTEACGQMRPRHSGVKPIRGATHRDYIFTFKPAGSNKAEVVIQGLNGKKFKGFMVQAVDRSGKTIGRFHGDSTDIQVMPECNSVTHYNARPKSSVRLVWEGPIDQATFRGTIAEEYSKIYMDMIAQPEGQQVEFERPLLHAAGPQYEQPIPHQSDDGYRAPQPYSGYDDGYYGNADNSNYYYY